MRQLRQRQPNFWKEIERLSGLSSLFDPEIENRARSIIEAVRQRGDRALLEFTLKFDGARLTRPLLRVTPGELNRAAKMATPELRAALRHAQKNIKDFSSHSLRADWMGKNREGGEIGEKFDPFNRVGIYIPGGNAPLVSTALMTVVLARAAGCRQIAVCTPCDPAGQINPALLFALSMAGATEVYRLGGAQAIAALALGTETIPRVQKVFGPGNAYVVAAKRLLFGHVAVDLLPGPSELLVVADDTADPRFISADLLAQAEHGSGHERVWLVSTAESLISLVEQEMTRQLPLLARRDCIGAALKSNGCLIAVRNLAAAVQVANQIAPEHCEIMTRQPEQVARRIVTAGSLFLGPFSPTVLGDYVAGPSHVLPTGGAARSFAGLTADQFQRRTSVVSYSKAALEKVQRALAVFARVEGLDAHGRSASIRREYRPVFR